MRADAERPGRAGAAGPPATEAGRAGLAALLRTPDRALIALDFDGTLSPIVPDPAAATRTRARSRRCGGWPRWSARWP